MTLSKEFLAIVQNIKIVGVPKESTAEKAKNNLREYFLTFDKRYKSKKIEDPLPKYVLFYEPFPALCLLREGDMELPFKKEVLTSFRRAYRLYMKVLREHMSKEGKKRKASAYE
jgi:hypothetical protein